MGRIKEINIKNCTYYFFSDMINIKIFNSNLLKIDKKSCKNIDIYYIGYITMKDFDYVNIHSLKPLYFVVGKPDQHIEEKMETNTSFLLQNIRPKKYDKIYRTLVWD